MKTFLLVTCGAFALFSLISAEETTCQIHKRNSRSPLMNWNIQCDEDGYYLPLQCTDEEDDSKKWCACYNKEEAITGPSKAMRHCDCPLAVDEAANTNGGDSPTCDNTGRWQPKQCSTSTNTCRCVDPDTGETTTESTTDPNLQCS